MQHHPLTSRQVVAHRTLDHFHQLHAGLGCGDAVFVQQLDHQAAESLEGSGDPRGRVYFYQNVVGCSNVNLTVTYLIQFKLH